MILSILNIVKVAALVVLLWRFLLAFLNGPVRDLLERVLGVANCGWYVSFLQWADRQITVVKRVVKAQWLKFRDTVLRVKSKYVKNEDGTYTKQTESLVRTSPTSGKRVVTEEVVGWEYLPKDILDEMLRMRAKEAELDDKAVIEERIRQRAEEEGIELAA